jgi:hypothetical protein
MSFGKPFRAAPVRLGAHYQAKVRNESRSSAAKLLGGAALAGLAIGLIWAASGNGDLARATAAARDAAASGGLVRRHDPPAGAYYSGCREARAAGVAPLYAGEPGYRPEMDGDGDGIACEPYHGM